MSNEMIERVVKAICNSYAITGFTGSMQQQIEMAKAAIEAMREPTEAMIEYADLLVPGLAPCCYYKTMIDAALKDG